MPRTVAQLSPLEICFIDGFVENDPVQFRAIVLCHFEERTVRDVQQQTGLPRATIHDLVTNFRGAYTPWRSARGDPSNDVVVVRAYLREIVGKYMDERLAG